jgi:hypothetical protein
MIANRFVRPGRWRRWVVGAAAGLAVLLLRPPGLGADVVDLPTVVRVEEDWSLLVNQPDLAQASPQVSTQMARSPTALRFSNFHLNSCDIPSFQQGGLQVQVWEGNTNLAVKTSDNRNAMSTDKELVTWTQYLRPDTGVLKFGISAASSQTWGDFSGIAIVLPGANTDLNSYSSNYSVQNSGVTFGANRVSSLVLVCVRIYYSDGSVRTDNTPHVVYSSVLDDGLNK